MSLSMKNQRTEHMYTIINSWKIPLQLLSILNTPSEQDFCYAYTDWRLLFLGDLARPEISGQCTCAIIIDTNLVINLLWATVTACCRCVVTLYCNKTLTNSSCTNTLGCLQCEGFLFGDIHSYLITCIITPCVHCTAGVVKSVWYVSLFVCPPLFGLFRHSIGLFKISFSAMKMVLAYKLVFLCPVFESDHTEAPKSLLSCHLEASLNLPFSTNDQFQFNIHLLI